MIGDKIAVTDRVVAHPTRPRLARVRASLIGVSMTKAKNKFSIGNSVGRLGAQARWGTPLSGPERFWGYVTKTDGCWLFHRADPTNGYGKFRTDNKEWRAHRYAWTITHGPIEPGKVICHRCDNKLCVNPAHLFLGTQTDNMRDAKAKGLAYRPGQHCKQGPDGRWVKKQPAA